jgi:drug/metabolite transporter (DMT)-like permease
MNRSAHASYAPYAAYVLLGVIWGANFLFMKWATALIPATQVVLLRVLFGFLPLLVYALVRGQLRWWHLRYWRHFLAMGLLATALYYFAFAAGTRLLPSGIAGMLSGAIPLASFLTAMLFLREEKASRATLAGLALGLAGIALIARPWQAGSVDPVGVAYMLAGSLSVGCSFVYARRFLTDKGIPAAALSTYQIGAALLMLAAVTDLHGVGRIAADPQAFAGLVLGLGVLGTGVAYMIYYYLIEKLGALRAASATYLPPVVALAIGHTIAGEPLDATSLGAMALILGGVWLLQSARQARPAGPVQGAGLGTGLSVRR